MKLLKNNKINKAIKYLKKYLNIIIAFLNKYKYIFLLSLPFILMDIITRLFGSSIGFYKIYRLSPNLFTLSWIILFIGLTLCFKKKIGKFIYLSINILFLILFLVNNVYYSMTKTFFDFNLLESASEGAPYILDTIKNCNPLVYLAFIIIIIAVIFGVKRIPERDKNNEKIFTFTVLLFLIMHTITPYTLGKANQSLTWSSWKNPRNIYNSFNDNNKSLKVSGLYEYSFRNFYITFLKTEKEENSEDIEFLNAAFVDAQKNKNKYTGIFKDKNIIFIQFEGLDNWLVTENDTPTIYKMMNNSFNFNNHYSYYNGGGSTFNSEFAVNTGFITPLSYTQNAYTFNKNTFPYSMAKIFKELNYTVNAFHMNSGEYYSRKANYKNWGYDNYYGLIDMFDYKDDSYTLDRELILNEKFNELLFPEDTSFVDYIITYSGHLPFTNSKGVCKLLYDLDHTPVTTDNDTEIVESDLKETKDANSKETKDANSKETVVIEREPMTEEECIRRQAKETDYMMELLLQNLEEKNLLDNTVIVAFSDHYLYTVEDKTILDKYKETSNNLINKTPFFIWSNDTKKNNINKVTSQLNILPTVLNLWGVDYNPNNYIGRDALDNNYDGIVFFSDYSWYDGNVYVENAEVINNKNISNDKLEEKNYYVSNITKKNDLTLKFNYFKYIKKNNEDSK